MSHVEDSLECIERVSSSNQFEIPIWSRLLNYRK